MKPRILLLEDDVSIAATVGYALEREGYALTHVALVQAAQAELERATPAAAVLDVGLPDGNGLELCRRWRADARWATLPLLMLTARSEEIDRVLGLEAGADDYLPKPFSPRELVARLRALLRRAAMPKVAATTLSWAGFELDEEGQRIHYAHRWLPLTRLEYGLLRELMRATGRIVSRERLFNRVWGTSHEAADRTVDTHVKTLRAKLRQADPGHEPIVTHRGMGYALADSAAAARDDRVDNG